MKPRTIKYFIKEGINNVWKNKWMSIASSCVILATLYIFGIFFLMALNVDNISGKIEDQPMHAFIVDTADSKTVNSVVDRVKKVNGVKNVVLIPKEKGFEKLKAEFSGNADLLKGLPTNFLPDKLEININNPKDAQTIKSEIAAIKEIYQVKYADETMGKVLEITKILRIVSFLIILVLGIVALFIIIYTIKLTVFSRRREINIMKYVGATDWFIKWPFVIEGIIIGLVGALASIIFIYSSYNYFYKVFEKLYVVNVSLVPLDSTMLLYYFTVIGTAIGAVGSVISVKKYLDV